MEQQDKELLLKDLCARLPYGVKLLHTPSNNTTTMEMIGYGFIDGDIHDLIGNFKPYLRPMISITENEMDELEELNYTQYQVREKEVLIFPVDDIDWLNAHHFDYHGLIDKGLALEAPEGMYRKENKL